MHIKRAKWAVAVPSLERWRNDAAPDEGQTLSALAQENWPARKDGGGD